MARANLGSLLSVATEIGKRPDIKTQSVSEQAEAEPEAVSKDPIPPTSHVTARRPRKTPDVSRRPASTAAKHWTEFERLEARLREDQVEQLDVLVRRLNKQRGGSGERITKNTLLRVAADLFLSRNSEIAGTSEEAIRSSLKL